jgi:hypothetical protein
MGPFGQNPRDAFLLQQLAGGFAPVASGRQHVPMTGLEGIPFMNQPGLMGIGMQMFVAPQLQKLMGNYGMSPMGLGHDMNIYDVMRNQQFTQAQHAAMAMASESDRSNYMQTFRGMAAIAGTPWGAQQRRAARQLTDTAGALSPMLVEMFPELMDQMGGMRGSATVMANRMMLGSRYRMDPITGRMGQTAETVGAMSNKIYEDLYNQGDLSAMRGITAGQLGGMYDELTRRGMIMGPQRSIRQRTMDALQDYGATDRGGLEAAALKQGVTLPADIKDISTEDLDKMRLDPAIADRLRSFDAERVKRSLKGYVDAVGAVRDIFGDAGRPNAPMAELIAALETMTQGGVGKIDPGRLNMMVRTTSELARQSGMTLDAAMAQQQHIAGRAQQLGIDPIHAVAANQGAMAWGGAFRAQGGSAVPAWGRMNADQMQQLDANLRIQAAASEQAQRLAVMMRVRDRVGGFAAGSEAEAMAEAIRSGQTEYMYGNQMKSTLMTGDQFGDIMLNAQGRNGQNLGLDEGTLASMLGQRFTNEEMIERYNIGGQVRRQQVQETRQWTGERFSEALAQRLRGAGMDTRDAQRIADRASGRISDRVGRMSQSDFADTTTRNAQMATIIQEELGAAGGADFIQQKGLTEDWFQLSANYSYGYVNRAIRSGDKAHFRSFQNMQATMNEETGSLATRNAVQARFDAETADALQPLGRGTMLQRAVQYLQDAGERGEGDFKGLISKAFGGVDNAEIQAGLEKPLLQVRDAQNALQELQQKYMRAETGPEKTRIMRQIEEQRIALRAAADNLTNTAQEYGIFTSGGDALTPEDATNALDAIRTMATGQQDLAGLSGDFAQRVTNKQLAEVTGTNFENAEIAASARYQRELAAAGDDEEARKKVETEFAEASGRFSTAAIDSWMKDAKIQEDEARDVIISRRGMIPLDPTDEQVREYAAEKGVNETQARVALTAQARADRFGIGEDEITKARNRLAPERRTRERAIDLAIQERMNAQLVVTAEQREKYRASRPELENASNDAIDREIRENRMAESKQRWGQFWTSDSGAAFRDSAEKAWGEVDDVATRMMMSKDMMRKLGPQAIQKFQALRARQQRMRELAAQYTDGDMARLLAGDFTNISDPEVLKNVRQEVFDTQGDMYQQVGELRDMMSQKGRNWGKDTEATARVLLGLDQDKTAKLTDTQEAELEQMRKDVLVAQKLTDKDMQTVSAFNMTHRTLSERAEALGATGMDLAKFLAGGGGPKGKERVFVPLTEEETARTKDADAKWEKAYDTYSAAKDAYLARKADLDEEKDPAKRAELAKEVARLEAAKDEAKDAVNAEAAKVKDLAESRGMTPDQFLNRYRTKNLMDSSTLKTMRDTFQKQQKLKGDLDERAGEIEGADNFEDIVGGAAAIERLDEVGQDFRDMETRSTKQYVAGMFKRAGLDSGEYDQYMNRLTAQLGSETGRGFMRRMIGTTEQLGGYASTMRNKLQEQAKAEKDPKKKAKLQARADSLAGEGKAISAAELVDQYQAMMAGEKGAMSMDEFRSSIGLSGRDNDEAFASFERAADFYQWTGMERLNDLDPEDRAARMAELMQSLDRGAAYQTPQTGEGQQQHMSITGQLEIVGNKGDLNAETGPR